MLRINLGLRIVKARLLQRCRHLRAEHLCTNRGAILPNRLDLLHNRLHQLLICIAVRVKVALCRAVDLNIQIRIVICFERGIRHQNEGADLAAADKAVATLKGYVVRRFHNADDFELRRFHRRVQILPITLYSDRAADLELIRGG